VVTDISTVPLVACPIREKLKNVRIMAIKSFMAFDLL
jgi:hypothetical protein